MHQQWVFCWLEEHGLLENVKYIWYTDRNYNISNELGTNLILKIDKLIPNFTI